MEQEQNKTFQEVIFVILCVIAFPILVLCIIIDTIRSFVSLGSRLSFYEATETTLDFVFFLATEIDDLRKVIWKALKNTVRSEP